MPNPGNGLRKPMQFQSDKVNPARRERCGVVIGRLTEAEMLQLDTLLVLMLGLGN